MDALLFLAHRIPYPPNKGDKIRSFHLLRHLARRYRVFLGAFVDDPDDWRHADALRELCADVHLVRLRPRLGRVLALRALLTGEPLSLPYFRSRSMRRWTDRILADKEVRRVFVFSSSMAQFVRHGTGVRKVIDFCDVDSDKWRQYGRSARWPLSRLYARESRLLLGFERRVARDADAALFVSQAEAVLFRECAPDVVGRIHVLENGVDASYFSPDREYPDPYGAQGPVLVFTGAMDYWANVDAVRWFAVEVFPAVRRRVPDVRFFIVGSNPTDDVVRLGRIPGIVVTGRVDDVRPYLSHAVAAVAPLRLARGVQNKVLEAMAMAKPVIASSPALDGIDTETEYPLRADAPTDWVGRIGDVLEGVGEAGIGSYLRDWVRRRYSWERSVEACATWLEADTTRGTSAEGI